MENQIVQIVSEVRQSSSQIHPDSCSKLSSMPLKALLLLCLFAGTVSTAFGQVLWSEEFDTGTSPDTTVWSYDLGASGWGNNELQEYTNSYQNVRVEDGNLVITVQKGANGFTSARMRTENKLTFKYGTIEARIKMPDLADGLWPAFWTTG